MMNRLRTLAPCVVAAATLLAACGRNDPIEQATPAAAPGPSIAEVKAIAEEGFIYGLPIVENYAVQYAYVIDRNSGQWKAPYNELTSSHFSLPLSGPTWTTTWG